MPNLMEIYQLLPKTNCKKCGKATCMAYAVDLLARKISIEDCPPLKEEKYRSGYEKLNELITPVCNVTETGFLVHEDKCIGCGNCVVACPVNVVGDPEGTGSGRAPSNDKVILYIKDGIVRPVNIHECRRFGPNKTLCYACIDTCPTKAIEFV